MPIYEYLCPTGHRFERIVSRTMAQLGIEEEPHETAYCKQCRTIASLVPSRTGTPILKEGVGGFHKPTKS